MFGLFKKKPDVAVSKLKVAEHVEHEQATVNITEKKIQILINKNRADLDYLVENLDLFAISYGNQLQFYWYRSHPEELDSELLCYEVPWVNVGAPETESEKLVALTGPDFSSSKQANLAFDLVVRHIIEGIKEETQNRNEVHTDDLPVYNCCRRLMASFDDKSLEAALKSEILSFKSCLELIIKEAYAKETAHLYQLLEKKKPYLRSKFINANRISYDEFGEPEQNDILETVYQMLIGINLGESYEERFRLFSLPEDSMTQHAIEYMNSWCEDFSAELAPTDGFEFEKWVADQLNVYGWVAYATKGSGDQGVDVVATWENMTIGIQCKRYSNSVGNKAVQEIYAGVKHMGLDKAAVLTNAGFTRSAKELAASTGVLLLSTEDIPELAQRC